MQVDNPGRTALVTGATGGIGGAVSRLLGEHGITVVGVGRDPDRLDSLAAASEEMIDTITCDLSDDGEVQRLGETVLHDRPGLNVVVLAAGAITLGAMSSLSASEWDRMFAVNVRANARLLGILGPTLKRNGGQVVLISSLAVTAPRAENAAYAATKAALGVVAQGIRDEYAGHVRVSTVLPGRTDTAMQRYVLDTEERQLDSDRLLTPHDVALAVLDVVMRPRNVDVAEVRIQPTHPAT